MRPSKIDRLPAELRQMIARLRDQGSTIDEIRTELRARGAVLSRSAIGLYTKRLDAASKDGLGAEILAIGRAVRRISLDLAALRRLIAAGSGEGPP